MDISRSGRVRKKSSKLADFESPDEIEGVGPGIRKAPKISTTKASTLGSSSAYNFIDSVPPMQLLADTGKSSEEDDDDIDITEAELNALPLNELDGDSDQDIDIEDENEGVNNDFLRKNRLSAFLLFAKKTKPRLIESNPGLDSGSLNLQLRELWSTLPNSERAIWKRKTSKIDIFPSQLQQRLTKTSAMGAPSMMVTDQMTNSSGLYKVTGTQPIDAAAHLKLLGESLSVIGQRLTEHKGQIAVSGSLSVLLDSLLCAMGPLVCLTKQVPELENAVQDDKLSKILDNIAYVMPGL